MDASDGVDPALRNGYTFGMKTAISLPDATFRAAERLAKATGKSRSKIFAEALEEYVARHDADELVEAFNAVADSLDTETNDFAKAANRRVFERNPW